MKVIFLDVDGILNCQFTKERFEGYIFVMDRKIELLKKLVDDTGAEIVLSSTWRQGWFHEQLNIEDINTRLFRALRNKLQEHGLEMIDYTPIKRYKERGLEIDAWLHRWTGEPVDSFVILDDLGGKYLRPHANRLVQTSFKEGLQEKHVELAKKILDKPWERE